ncbi:MAG: Cof-type HAD-IIB family hydrolase [Clostridia bacterium]|nr:Cof-type HAD-IIB family hydrolase [Clostridia bacterium]
MKPLPFKGVLLVSDMDGTLLNSSNRISDENRKAIENFVEGGGLFTIATGRSSTILEKFLKELPVNIPVIVINGAQIFDFKKKEVLFRWALEKDIESTVRYLLDSYPSGLGMEIFSDAGVFVVRENEITEEHRSRECIMPGAFEIKDIPKPWYKVVLAWENEKLKLIEAGLEGKMGTAHSAFSELRFLDITHKNASKGIALRELCNILGRSYSRVIAVGDNLNDLEMFKAAGIGIAVENAHEELKKHAAFCTNHHDQHAIAEIIRWIEEKSDEEVEDD